MKKTIIITILIALFSLTAISAEKIRVASKSFTEGYILGSMVVELLENAGYKVDYKDGMSSFIIRSALVNDQIDLYVEYTGTAWMAYLKQQDIIDDPVLLLEKVREKDLLGNGIVWYDAIDFNNTYGLAIKEEFARENNLETLSDLADYINQNNKLIFGVNFDFFERPDGFFAMAEITVWSSVKRTSKPWKSVSPMKHYQEAISMWPWFFQQTGNWINIT